ncbi:hypothetical protein AK812_SmicGene27162 [Symbiodinium microadriaticum]|uniref:Cytochrome b561 domain-containing protein n=1 Tax=Symbiodinium microadriaticum TaxID=2951 RepID=A0A1Q9D7I9_SYMMI|nr:hypothetical protein AK812_SmicGene27162 [Symbiodinium microadriaticum]CAE7712834.1 unnamed protein product [Symbiodinium sp. KB8]
MAYLLEGLYVFHSGIEMLAGSFLFLRGRGSNDPASEVRPVAKLYRRWHGAGLLGLSFLGWLVIWKGQLRSEVGRTVSQALALFHFGAVAAHVMAAVESNNQNLDPTDEGYVSTAAAAKSPHVLLTIGFLAHAAGSMD